VCSTGRGRAIADGQDVVGELREVIVRVLRARIRPGRVGAFNAVFRAQVPLLKEQPGLVYVKLARRLQSDGGEDVVLFEEWQDAASLYAWVGPNLMEPRLVAGAKELIDDLVVAHYEALDKDNVEMAAVIDTTASGEPFEGGGVGPPEENGGPPADSPGAPALA
jgi:heme-degrading monooxygenase HmoA